MTHHLAIDYLATARTHADDATAAAFGSATQATHLALAQTYATLAIATALPQGTVDAAGDTPCTVGSAPSPAEPSLVALDRADEITSELRRWREADRIFPVEAAEWWDATLRLRDVADRLGGAR